MRDLHLILFVLALVLIDVVFITAWIFYDPLKLDTIIFDDLVRIFYLWCTTRCSLQFLHILRRY